MIANELIARAEVTCRRLRRTLAPELKAYASDWPRQGDDLSRCWGLVKSALTEGRAVWQVDAAVRIHHACLQAAREARGRSKSTGLTASSELKCNAPALRCERANATSVGKMYTQHGADAHFVTGGS